MIANESRPILVVEEGVVKLGALRFDDGSSFVEERRSRFGVRGMELMLTFLCFS